MLPENRTSLMADPRLGSFGAPVSVNADNAPEERLANVAAVLLFVSLAVIVVLPLFSRYSWLVFVQDDFLYYLKVAQNLAHGRGSTFNGLVPTNGYQPLWFLVLVVLSRFTEAWRPIMGFLAVSNWLAALVTFFLARRLLRLSGARPLLIFAFSAAVTLYSIMLFFYCMEVTLTVPMLLGTICLLLRVDWVVRGWRQTFMLGLLLSALALSRIDTLIFDGLVLAGILLTPALRKLIRAELIFGVALGLFPLVGYAVLNRVEFGTFLPISGLAKELKFNHLPSPQPWGTFFHLQTAVFTLVFLVALALLPRIARGISSMARVLFLSVLVFPFVYYFILCCISDWQLWGWYMYPLRISLCISLLIFALYPPFARQLQRPAVVGALVVAMFAALPLIRWRHQQEDIYAASLDIANFAQSHPGIYAMGDRAGRVAALIPDPMVQTEGLMMDLPYLQFVKQQRPLREVLNHYNVRYYVATAYKPFTGCFQAIEPQKAGPHSAHMRDQFCEQPQATFFHYGVETLIFDLKARDGASLPPS